MGKQIISTAMAPKAVGPYSQAVVYKNLLFISGQIGTFPADGKLPEEFAMQAKNAFYNLKAIAESAGSRLNRSLKVTVYLTDINRFAEMNEIYTKFFIDELPAREVVAVAGLPKNAQIEVSAIAYARDDT